MKRLHRHCLVVAASLVLACCFVSPSIAQSGEAEKLQNQVIALYNAGKYAEAIPLAQRELAIYEKTLGPDHRGAKTPLVQ